MLDRNSDTSTLQNEEKSEISKLKDLESVTSKNDTGNTVIQLSKTRFCLVIMALFVALLIASLDLSIISTALPVISEQFHSHSDFTWAVTAYMLTETALQPMYGKFADIFGRRSVMVVSLVIFVLSSAMCGASQNMMMLIFGRGLQGVGGSGIMALVNIITADIVPIEKRGSYMGLIGTVFAFSSVVGPLIGGFFTDHLTWRWAFYINIPLGIITIVVIILYVNIPNPKGSIKEKILRVDFLGTILLVACIIIFLLALNWGGSKYEWSSPIIIILFVVSVILLVLFIIVEFKFAKEPIVPYELFTYRNVYLSFLVSFFAGACFLTATTTIPLIYQDGLNISATYSGLRMTPMSVTISIGSIGSGVLIGKFGYIERYIQVGGILTIISCYFVTLIGEDTLLISELLILALFGFSVGLNMQNIIVVTQQASPNSLLAISTSVVTFFRIIGGAVFVTIFGTISQLKFVNLYGDEYPDVPNVTVNDVHTLERGESIYVKALNFGHLATILPASILSFIFAIFLKKISLTQENQKSINEKQEMEMDLKKNTEKIEIEITEASK